MLTEEQVRAMCEEAKVHAILDLQQQIATLAVRLTELEARLNKNRDIESRRKCIAGGRPNAC